MNEPNLPEWFTEEPREVPYDRATLVFGTFLSMRMKSAILGFSSFSIDPSNIEIIRMTEWVHGYPTIHITLGFRRDRCIELEIKQLNSEIQRIKLRIAELEKALNTKPQQP